MGKDIVYEESPIEPGKRSRLWHHEDAHDVLSDCRGTEKIRGIVVNLPKPYEITLNPKSFLKMVNLEFFINRNAHFSGRVDYLPNSLRLIEFGGRFNIAQKHTYELILPSNFHPRHLVTFDVSYSGIRQLKGFKNLAKLTRMNLRGCKFLEKIPDLSGSPNIKHLYLSHCTSLVEVDDSVGFLDKLKTLNLYGCSNLARFATRLGLRSLEELDLCECTRLERFPEIEKDKMKSLTKLDIGRSGIRELPSSIAYLAGLKQLHASGCELQNVPDLSGSPNIETLDLSHCTSLVEVDDSVGFLDKLEILNLAGCFKLTRFATRLRSRYLRRLYIGKSGIRELPSIAYFNGLETVNASGCELQNIQLLPDGNKVKFDEGSSRLSLDLSGCKLSESDFLVPLDCWSTLRELNLSRNNFVSLPDCISKAVNLMTLNLRDCEWLREISVLPPKLWELHLDDCTSLEKIPKLPPRLEVLTLCNCSGLSGDEVAKLLVAKLENEWWDEEIDLSRNNFVSLPDCISQAVNLLTLDLSDCKWLREIPALPPKLESLCLDGCTSLKKIPQLHQRLENLRLCNCSGLSSDEVAKFENNLLNEDILVARLEINLLNRVSKSENGWLDDELYPPLSIIYPGNEVPKWFSYTSNHPTTIQPLPHYLWDEIYRKEKFVGGSEFRFEIPLKLQEGETLLGLALSYVLEPFTYHCLSDDTDISINGEIQLDHLIFYHGDLKATHVRLALVDGLWYDEDQDICQVVFRFRKGCPIKSCGVHCLLRNQDSGSSYSEDEEDEEDEEREQEQPSDSDIEEDEDEEDEEQEQEQPRLADSGSDGISQQDLQTNSNMVPTAGRQLAKSLELQISEVVNSCRENKVGPIEGLKVYPRHATAAKLQMQKMQEMEQLASAQGLPTDRNTLNKLMALHPGLNNQMNNHHQMVGPGAYQNLLLRHNSMNSNANSLQQEASSSFNNSNRIPSSTFQGAAALIPGSMHNLPGCALSSAHLPSRQPQQLQQRSLSSNSLLQQTHSTGSQGNQALQQQMIQQLPQEMSNNSRGGQQSLPCPSANGSVGRNGVSFGGNNVPGSHGPAPSRNNSFKAPANSDNSTGGGGNNTYNQRAPDLPSNLHLQEDLVQEIAREFTENGFFNSNRDDNMYPQISSDIVLRPTSSLGKRPHPRGSSDIDDDEYDHPKRRQIDIEEEEEQEQPFASDDPQFQIS